MKGILLVNLGSPESPDPRDVKIYLGEFLMDKRVIDLPFLFRALLVKGIILNTRPKKSALAYQKIWTKDGFPLISISQKLVNQLQEMIDCPVALGMRYGSMSIQKGLQELTDKGVDEVLLIPLYPQFAMSTTESVIEKTKEVTRKYFNDLIINVLPAFYNDEEYLNALVSKIKTELNGGDPEFMLFSYHGIPERHIKKSDITKSHCKIDDYCCQNESPAHQYCYRHQCFKTTERIVEKLNLKEGTYQTSFQSRFGNDPWLQPYTSTTLENLAKSGKKKVKVVAPAFVTDCLETLEELKIENKKVFINASGEDYQYLSCLNNDPQWLVTLRKWCNQWLEERNQINYIKVK